MDPASDQPKGRLALGILPKRVTVCGIFFPMVLLYLVSIHPSLELKKDYRPQSAKFPPEGTATPPQKPFHATYTADQIAKSIRQQVATETPTSTFTPTSAQVGDVQLVASVPAGIFAKIDGEWQRIAQQIHDPHGVSVELSGQVSAMGRELAKLQLWQSLAPGGNPREITRDELSEINKVQAAQSSQSSQAQKATTLQDDANLSTGAQLLMAQHQKCVEEIRTRLDHEERWFELKFTFIGVLLLGFFAQAVFSSNKEGEEQQEINKQVMARTHESTTTTASEMQCLSSVAVAGILRSPITSFVVALAAAVSLIADMHVRAGRTVIQQNGSWIAYFVEPAMLGANFGPEWGGQIVGWEQFLRLEAKDGSGLGHHNDTAYNLLFWPQMFVVTAFIYGAYLRLFAAQVYDPENKGKVTDSRYRSALLLTRVGFFALHGLIVICAISTACVPSAFSVRVPFTSFTIEPFSAVLCYAIGAAVLVGLSLIFVFQPFARLRKLWPFEEQSEAPNTATIAPK